MAEAISKEQFASLIAKNQTDSSVLKNLPDLITELKKLTTTLSDTSLTSKTFTFDKSITKEPLPVTISDISSASYKKLESLFKIIRIEKSVIETPKTKTTENLLLQAILSLNKKINKLQNVQKNVKTNVNKEASIKQLPVDSVVTIKNVKDFSNKNEKNIKEEPFKKNNVLLVSLVQDIKKTLTEQKTVLAKSLSLVNRPIKVELKEPKKIAPAVSKIVNKPIVTDTAKESVNKPIVTDTAKESKKIAPAVSKIVNKPIVTDTAKESKKIAPAVSKIVNKPIVTDTAKESKKTISTINKLTTNELLVNKPIKVELKEPKKATPRGISTAPIAKNKSEKINKVNNTKQEKITAEKSATDIALETKEPEPFILFDVSTVAYKKLETLFNNITGKQATPQVVGGKKPQKSAWGKGLLGNLLDKINLKDLLSKSAFGKALSSGLLSALGGLGASLALAIGSWFNDGPWKGTMKLVGEIGTKIFLPKVTTILTKFFPNLFNTFVKGMQGIGAAAGGLVTKLLPTTGVLGKMAANFLGFFTPLLKRLPVIGTIINIGSAISRFIKGDIIGGLIDIGSAVAVLVPGVGTAISIGLGLLNAGRDLTGESKKSTGEQVANIGSILGKAVDWIKNKIKDLFNYYFGKLTRGIKQIKSGDYIRGVVTLASFVPGLWWLETVYNWLAGPPPTPPEDKNKKEDLPSDIVGKAYDWVKGKLKGLFNNYFGKLTRGIKQIKSGDYIRGLVTLASFVPGMWWLESVYNWLAGPSVTPPEDKDKKEDLPTDVVGKAYGWVKTKLKNLFTGWFSKFGRGWDLIKSGNYFEGVVVWASTIPGFGWLSSLYDWIAGPEEAPSEESSGESMGFDWKKIYTAIKDSIKKKLKSVLDKLKKLPFVPDKLVDKIGEFLGLNEKAEADAGPAPTVATNIATPKSNATTTAKAPTALNAATIPNANATELPPTPDQVVNTNVQPLTQTLPQPTTVEQQAVQAQQDSAERTQQALSNVSAPEVAQIPLPVLPTPSTDNKQLLSTLTGMLEKMTPTENKKITTMASNSVANADNSTVNIYNGGNDRDIPYVERNKYRQQLLYIRGIL